MHPILETLAGRTLSVTEYLDLINELMGPLKVFVEGEITDLKILPQWTFFSLKDAESGSLLRCGLHSQVYRKLGVNVEEGMKVKVEGYGKISPKSGNFGFWVSSIEPVGEGALKRAYELLVKKFTEEGLFARKRELPSFISHIGVISSRNGVVIQDLRNNLDSIGIRVDFLHSGVEGPDSAQEILRAIEYFSGLAEHPQVLVLIRGGGSMESLQGFNNEAVCRALYRAPMPVLVGIGHDVDAPIATMVADWSASTPTAVAHVINDSWAPITERVPLLAQSLTARFSARLSSVDRRVPFMVQAMRERFTRRLHATEHRGDIALRTMRHAVSRIFTSFARYEAVLRHAQRQVPSRLKSAYVDSREQVRRAQEAFRTRVHRLLRSVEEQERLLHVSDPERVLSRGYGLLYSEGRLVRSIAQVSIGATIETRLADGAVQSVIQEIHTTSK
jgi:exodeoxyribonuclease VII large subunit